MSEQYDPWRIIDDWIMKLPTRVERNFASMQMPLASAFVEAQRHYGGPPMLLWAMREMVEGMR